MEEELHYATVVFKNGGSPQKENDEDSTIYCTIKSEVPAATVEIKAAGGAAGGTAAGGAAAGGAAAGGAAGGGAAAGGTAAAHSRHFVLLLVCSGILCVLLMACIGVIIYICGVMKAQEAREFINNHTKYYHDKHHGYWMGLRQNDDKWIWINGPMRLRVLDAGESC
ncbi:uncharacterized protein LOC118113832 [Hippoglossus stenolepis]|uniref:uncharacterized protein LOC118113832 n=1 Tax=Hippoglossus stenolepis TaxID=195615 RepID=UPI001FB035AE|nr:uncharacterized protein LOC118113832 [Hippoglossus stenolepis]